MIPSWWATRGKRAGSPAGWPPRQRRGSRRLRRAMPGWESRGRAQSEQREGVGGEHEVGVLGDAVDGGDRVDREHHVGSEHRNDDDGHRGERAVAVLADGQPGGAVAVGDGHQLAQEPDRAHRRYVRLADRSGEQLVEELGRRDEQDSAEHQERPGPGLHHRGADRDEDPAQDQGADDPVQQHPLCEFSGHRERGEQEDEHEQVVDRQGLLHQEAGGELQCMPAAVSGPQGNAEHDRQREVEHRPGDGFAQLHRRGRPCGRPS